MEIKGGRITGGSLRGQQDWHEVDRVDYYRASNGGLPVNPNNSFFKASLYNTQNYLPEEYDIIWLRHVYYDWVSYLLKYPMDKTWNKVKDIRFFDAVNITTGVWGLSSAPALQQGTVTSALSGTFGGPQLSSDTVTVITAINQMLFKENMIVIKNLFFDIKFPFIIPQGCFVSVQKPIEMSALNFDLQMVEFEQRAVATYINLNQSLFTAKVVKEVNNLMNYVPPAIGTFLVKEGIPRAKKLLNVSYLNFMEYKHREAIGKAMVFFLHRKSEAEFLKFMGYKPLPQNASAPTPQARSSDQFPDEWKKNGKIVVPPGGGYLGSRTSDGVPIVHQ